MGYFISALSLLILLVHTDSILAQVRSSNDALSYEKYERENVSTLRERFSFSKTNLSTNNNEETPSQLSSDEDLLPSFSEGNVVFIESSPKLDAYIERHKEFNRETKYTLGYRISIPGLRRSEAQRAKIDVELLYPGYNAEIEYQQPDYRVIIGNFLKEVDAEKFKEKIKFDFRSALVVPGKVIIPKYELEPLEDDKSGFKTDP